MNGYLLFLQKVIKMEEEKKEILVIKSDKEWIQYFKARVSGIIPFMLMEIVVVIAFNYDLRKRKAVVPEIANVLEKCIIVGFIIVNIFFNKIIYVFLTIFLYLLKCPQSLILSALRAFCFCGKAHIPRSIFLYFRYQSWLKSW